MIYEINGLDAKVRAAVYAWGARKGYLREELRGLGAADALQLVAKRRAGGAQCYHIWNANIS